MSKCTQELYEGGGNSHPFSSTACIKSCCDLLGAIDSDHLGKECCKELLSSRVFKTLGEAIAADWGAISERLAQRAGNYFNEPAWLQDGLERCVAPVSKRLRQACCSSEVAVLMLRLAVRTACLGSSWYGPWDSLEALQQLVKADAWASLVRALRALVSTFGAALVRQFNAVNIVGDILHVSCASLSGFPLLYNDKQPVCLGYDRQGLCMAAQIFYSLSERHTHLEFSPSECSPSVHIRLQEALFLVTEGAAYLPRLHRHQANQGDTALLMVSPPQAA